jgi:hypothetical protein
LLHQKCYTTRMKKRVKIKALTAPNNIPGASWNAPDTGLGAPWNGPRKTRDHALSRLQFVLINKGNDGASGEAYCSPEKPATKRRPLNELPKTKVVGSPAAWNFPCYFPAMKSGEKSFHSNKNEASRKNPPPTTPFIEGVDVLKEMYTAANDTVKRDNAHNATIS